MRKILLLIVRKGLLTYHVSDRSDRSDRRGIGVIGRSNRRDSSDWSSRSNNSNNPPLVSSLCGMINIHKLKRNIVNIYYSTKKIMSSQHISIFNHYSDVKK